MKHRILSLFISLITHFLLIFVFFIIFPTQISRDRQVQLLFEIENHQKQPVPDHSNSEPVKRQDNLSKPSGDRTMLHETIDPSSLESFIKREKKKAEMFISKPSQNLQTEAPIALWTDVKFLPRTTPRYDPVAEQIRSQEMGNVLLFAPVPEPVMKKKVPVQFNFIPSEAQVRSLQQLYEKSEATQVELYPNLALSKPVTAEDYNKSLDMLVQKGFVSRKKISPQNILHVMGIPVELSSRNRRNPVFLYTANVKKNKVIIFLQAQLQQLKERQAVSLSDSMGQQTKMDELKHIIQILTHQ